MVFSVAVIAPGIVGCTVLQSGAVNANYALQVHTTTQRRSWNVRTQDRRERVRVPAKRNVLGPPAGADRLKIFALNLED
jgi:hypothetical protein